MGHKFLIDRSRILIVDDVEVNTIILKKILQNEGYEIFTASDGETAIDITLEHKPDLILLDIVMPGIGGIEACQIIKNNPEIKDIPIIFISGKRESEDIIAGFQAGGVDYIQKPFYPKELIARVTTHLSLRKAVLEIEASEKAWKKIAKERDLFANLFIQSKHGVIITDLKGVITHVNNTFLEVFGYRRLDLIGNSTSMLGSNKTDHSVYKSLWKNLKDTTIGYWTGELINKTAKGEEITILLTIDTLKNSDGDPIGFSGNYIDTAELNKLKQMKYELEKQKIYETKLRQIILGLCAASEYSDETTGKHVIRVNEYAQFIAEKMGLDDKFISTIGMVAALHDIGKVAIQSLIKFPGRYSPEQRFEMQKHTVYGADIISKFADEKEYEFKMARDIALNHHQTHDGEGYPELNIDGESRPLKGDEIPISALIVSLADSYDALRSKRSYKKAMTHDQVCEILAVDDRTGKKGFDRFGPVLWPLFLEYNKEFDRIYKKHQD